MFVSKDGKVLYLKDTAQKIKFFIKDFFSKCDQIPSFLRIWSHLLKKSIMEYLIFCTVRRKGFLVSKVKEVQIYKASFVK